ncbi:hypothetical protein [Anaerolentibacter hominis]|uniref:hypothetical protein n=1 Tax=Anaerolentibacter hominis TaxID=3079009 RepID=UPI0031B83AAD
MFYTTDTTTFQTVLFGYSPRQILSYLEQLSEAMEEEEQEYKTRLAQQQEQLQFYKTRYEELGETVSTFRSFMLYREKEQKRMEQDIKKLSDELRDAYNQVELCRQREADGQPDEDASYDETEAAREEEGLRMRLIELRDFCGMILRQLEMQDGI